MKTTILFDLDGTLLNTLDDLADAVNYALESLGYPAHSTDVIRQYVGNGIAKLIERAIPDGLDNPDYKKCYDCFVEYYGEHSRVKTDLYPGIRDLLPQLAQKGVKLAVVTNKLQEASDTLAMDFFNPYITVIVGDAPGRNKKPHPDGVNEAIRQLNVTDKSQVLYIGDSDVDAMTAINSDIDYLLCLWGFRSYEQLSKYKPLAFINEPSDILKYI